jgi:large subunit ribosomal protein L18
VIDLARGALYKVMFRRRREGATDYRLRRRLLLSGKPLLIARKTNRHIIAQLVKPRPQGDEVIASATSMELRKYRWRASSKNSSAAYLVGYLLGLKALRKGVKEAVLYIGLHQPVKGAAVFAVLKGALDAGLEVPHREEVLPDEDRIEGRHVEAYAKQLLEQSPQLYERRFSKYLKEGVHPEELSRHFERCLEQIKKAFIGSSSSKNLP